MQGTINTFNKGINTITLVLPVRRVDSVDRLPSSSPLATSLNAMIHDHTSKRGPPIVHQSVPASRQGNTLGKSFGDSYIRLKLSHVRSLLGTAQYVQGKETFESMPTSSTTPTTLTPSPTPSPTTSTTTPTPTLSPPSPTTPTH